MRSLETPSEMLRRLAGLHPGSVHLPALGNAAAASSATPVGEILACQRCGDRARFCSEECRREAWGSYHSRLCVGVDGHEKAGLHPVEALEEFWK